MLTHDVASLGLLLSTVILMPKDKRDSKCDSKSYTFIYYVKLQKVN